MQFKGMHDASLIIESINKNAMKIDINNPIKMHKSISFNEMIKKEYRRINNLQKIMMNKFKEDLKGKEIYLLSNGNIRILNY